MRWVYNANGRSTSLGSMEKAVFLQFRIYLYPLFLQETGYVTLYHIKN